MCEYPNVLMRESLPQNIVHDLLDVDVHPGHVFPLSLRRPGPAATSYARERHAAAGGYGALHRLRAQHLSELRRAGRDSQCVRVCSQCGAGRAAGPGGHRRGALCINAAYCAIHRWVSWQVTDDRIFSDYLPSVLVDVQTRTC